MNILLHSHLAPVVVRINSSTLGYPQGELLQVNLGRGAPCGYPRSTLYLRFFLTCHESVALFAIPYPLSPILYPLKH
jgi:hypothetical protein